MLLKEVEDQRWIGEGVGEGDMIFQEVTNMKVESEDKCGDDLCSLKSKVAKIQKHCWKLWDHNFKMKDNYESIIEYEAEKRRDMERKWRTSEEKNKKIQKIFSKQANIIKILMVMRLMSLFIKLNIVDK